LFFKILRKSIQKNDMSWSPPRIGKLKFLNRKNLISDTHRLSSCFSLDIENGISPLISLNDKSLRRQRKSKVQVSHYDMRSKYKLNSSDCEVKTYKLFNQEQSPSSSGIWPDNRFSLRSLYQKSNKEDKQILTMNE
jgi:hypothetical protein